MGNKAFYVTTPIYYVNGTPHIGHAYTTVAADITARFKRLDGYDVFFLTGTDEHGQKVYQAAKDESADLMGMIEGHVQVFKKLWNKLNITNDDFIRTTQERHKNVVLEIMQKIYNNGDIYVGSYRGPYCYKCETFFTDKQLIDNLCPLGHKVMEIEEKGYFFKLSKYQDRLLCHIEQNKDFITPECRRNEIVSFINSGLKDLCISRSSIPWGIELNFPDIKDKKHVLYVWIDALINYISGVGYLSDMDHFKKFWPEVNHIIGKDIIRHHAVYWPIVLMSAGLDLPKHIVVHGWWNNKGVKISKSLNNAIDPFELVDKYGQDAIRYFLFREVPFGLDGDFSEDALIGRINSDLANNLGNLVKRSLIMAEKYLKGFIDKQDVDAELSSKYTALLETVRQNLEVFNYNAALNSILEYLDSLNKYIDKSCPWNLANSDVNKLKHVLYTLLASIAGVSVLLYPFIPGTAEAIWDQLGLQDIASVRLDRFRPYLIESFTVKNVRNLFNRI